MKAVPLSRWLAFLVTLALALPACSSPAGETAVPSAPAETEAPFLTPTPAATLPLQSSLGVEEEALRGMQVSVWHGWFGAEATLFQSQVAQFNTDNPWGIVVLVQPQGNYTELFNAVSAALAGSQRPDLAIALPEQALAWDQGGAVADLELYVRDPVFGLSPAELADFPSPFLEGDMLEGRRLGLPAERTARLLLYNQTWARELGFNTAPLTPAEFEEQTCAANRFMRSDAPPDNDGQGGWLVDANPMTALTWMQAFDGGFLARDGFRFLTHPNLDALTFVKELYDRGCAWMSIEGSDQEHFASRRALFATASLEEFFGQSQAFLQAGNRDEWTVLPFPGSTGRGFMIYGSSYVLLKSEDTRQLAAWLFMRWMLASQNQVRWVQGTGLYPLRASMLPDLAEYHQGHPQWAAAVELIPQGQTPPKVAYWRKIRPVVGDAFLSMFRLNIATGQLSALLARMDAAVADLQEK